jgi:hypothetical protein
MAHHPLINNATRRAAMDHLFGNPLADIERLITTTFPDRIPAVERDTARHMDEMDAADTLDERRETVANALLCGLCDKNPSDMACEFADYVLQDGTRQAELLAALFRNDQHELARLRGVYWDEAVAWADERAKEIAR